MNLQLYGLGKIAHNLRNLHHVLVSLLWTRAIGHRLCLRRLAGFVGVLCLGFYLLGVTGWFLALKHHRKVDGVQWRDALLPTRWTIIQLALGEHAISRGLEYAAQGQWVEAAAHLSTGLRRSHGHREARLLLVEIRTAHGSIEHAARLLEQGLEFHANDIHYLEFLFAYYDGRRDDARILDITNRLLFQVQGRAKTICVVAGARAALNMSDLMSATRLLTLDAEAEHTSEGRILHSHIEWEAGHRELALLRLRTAASPPQHDGAAHYELGRRLREMGEASEARRRALEYALSNPDVWQARLALAYAYQATNDPTAARREAEALLASPAQTLDALLALAGFAASVGAPDLAHEAQSAARLNGADEEAWKCLLVESHLVRGEFTVALTALRTLQRAENSRTSPLVLGLQGVAYAGSGDLPQARLAIKSVLDQLGLRAEHLRALAEQLHRVGASDESFKVLQRAAALDRTNPEIVGRLLERALDERRISEVPTLLLHYVTLRRPSPDILRVAQDRLGSDLYLFASNRDEALRAVNEWLARNAAQRLARH